MDEINKPDDNGYAYLHWLSIDKLVELLSIAPVFSTCPEDMVYVEALEEAIIEKENKNPTGFFPDIDQQWEQFVTHYKPDTGEALPRHTEHMVPTQIFHQSPDVPPKRVVSCRQVWRRALAAVLAVACILGIILTAQAAGIDVFGAMARWTRDTFSFGQIPSNSAVSKRPDNEMLEHEAESSVLIQKFSSLQAAFDAYGITEIHEPAHLPDGYIANDIDVTYESDSDFSFFAAEYICGTDLISITIMSYEDEPSMLVQKTDMSVDIIERGGISFYLIENTSSYTVAWYDSEYEYYISGKLDKELLLEIAGSMYE